MNGLLDSVIEAHGGADRWGGFSDLVTDVNLSGQLFQEAGWSAMLPQSRFLIALRSQRTLLLLPEGRGNIVLEPDQLIYRNGARKEIERISDPAARISQLPLGFRLDTVTAAYLLIDMVRRSVEAPFLYRSRGYVTEEIAPRSEDGEIWRVLKITFLSGGPRASRVQYAYYGLDGLLRCLRYITTLCSEASTLSNMSVPTATWTV